MIVLAIFVIPRISGKLDVFKSKNLLNMKIYELSFQCVKPLASLSFFSHQVDLKEATTPDELASKLGKLANQLLVTILRLFQQKV